MATKKSVRVGRVSKRDGNANVARRKEQTRVEQIHKMTDAEFYAIVKSLLDASEDRILKRIMIKMRGSLWP